MEGIAAPMTCPACSGDVELVAKGVGTRFEARCVVACERCNREWLVTVTLSAVNPRAATPAKRESLERVRQAKKTVTPTPARGVADVGAMP